MSTTTPTAQSLGFRMPAEWEPQESVWLSWPYNEMTWEGTHLVGAEEGFGQIIAVMTKYQRVDLLVPNASVKTRALKKLEALGADMKRLTMHEIESGDVWIRDYGPIFVKNTKGEIAWTKWEYNAYGGKYEDLLIGNDVPDKMPLDKSRRFGTGIILEGGSIDVNGQGTLITTESCLLSPDRNPNLTKKDIEHKLRDFLGITNVLWLSSGIEGDDTTGHVDDLTRFVGPSTVVTVTEKDPTDPNFAPLNENANRLKTMKDERGMLLTVIDLPMPREFVVEGRRMAASYANFYIGNGVVLVPTYAQPSDSEAVSILQGCFPDRDVIGIDCRELIWGYGSIHCATQQQPA